MNLNERVGGGWYSSRLLEHGERVQLDIDAVQNECAGKLIITTQRILWLPSVFCESQQTPWINLDLAGVENTSVMLASRNDQNVEHLCLNLKENISFLFFSADPHALSAQINRLLRH